VVVTLVVDEAVILCDEVELTVIVTEDDKLAECVEVMEIEAVELRDFVEDRLAELVAVLVTVVEEERLIDEVEVRLEDLVAVELGVVLDVEVDDGV